MKQRILSALLAVCMLASLLPVSAFAEAAPPATPETAQSEQSPTPEPTPEPTPAPEADAVAAVQAQIDVLPTAEEIAALDEAGKQGVFDALTAIDEAMDELEETQLAALDMTKYEAAYMALFADTEPATVYAAPTIDPVKPALGTGTAADPYQIANAANLYWFAAKANTWDSGTAPNAGICAVLTDNITVNTGVLNADGTRNGDGSNFTAWAPMGTFSGPYTGTFDGAGHTISGLYYSQRNGSGVGLFGIIDGATVKNVTVADSYFEGCKNIGGVCGFNKNGTITNCINRSTVKAALLGTTTDQYAGGVCGYNTAQNSTALVQNCYNAGKVIGDKNAIGGVCGGNATSGGTAIIQNCYNTGAVNGDAYVGGVCGMNYNTNSGATTIENCYNTGTVTGNSSFGGVYGGNNTASDTTAVTVTNCYYLADSETDGQDGTTYKTTDDFQSGAVAWLLNGSSGENPVWYQTLGEADDASPVLDATHGTVYTVFAYDADGFITQEQSAYGNQTPETQSIYQAPAGKGTTERPYQIANIGNLYWFAALVNGDTSKETGTGGLAKNAAAHAKLTANITVNENVLGADGILNGTPARIWTPIGNEANPYTGTFDGDNHTISGLYFNDTKNYVGLFGHVQNGAVKNVTVADSYLKGDSYVGGVCGYNYACNGGTATLQNCDNTGAVTGGNYVGGVSGYNYAIETGTATLQNCDNTGAVTGGSNVGGVSGYNEANSGGIVTVKSCTNSGTVSGTSDYVGGVCGYNNAFDTGNTTTIQNCYNTGAVKGGNCVGGVCGENYANTENNTATLQNCYNTGAVTGGSNVGGVCGKNYAVNNGSATIQNCYYDKEKYKGNAVGSENGTTTNTAGHPTSDFTSGAVAWLLNGSSSENPVWCQTLGEASDASPVLDATHGTVYTVFAYDADGFITEEQSAYSNQTPETQSIYQAPAGKGTTESPYQIGNIGNLYWFAALVNGDTSKETGTGGLAKNAAAHAKLTANITVNENVLGEDRLLNSDEATVNNFRAWTPIGSGPAYTGTFDGAGHTISGLYYNNNVLFIGLFCSISKGGKVQNLSIADSYFAGNTHVGGVAGHNDGTITGCNNGAMIQSYENLAGGICGKNEGTIQYCTNSGKLIAKVIYYEDGISNCVDYYGGVAGRNSGTITSCSNSGEIYAATSIGGVCGTNDSGGVITSCFNSGKLGAVDMLRPQLGGVCGVNNGTINNCYFDKDKTTGNLLGKGAGNILINYDKSNAGYSTETIESGQITWWLNGTVTVDASNKKTFTPGPTDGTQIWYQNLGEGGDVAPVLDTTHGTVYKTVNDTYTNTKPDTVDPKIDLSKLTGTFKLQEENDKKQFSMDGGTSWNNYIGSVTLSDGMTKAPNQTVCVSSGEHNITLSNATLAGNDASSCPFYIESKATVNLTLLGTNTAETAKDRYAGIQVMSDAELIITAESTGALTARGGPGAAGIGGGYNSSEGTITINGGTVTAFSGNSAAGIGGGQSGGSNHNIRINGGIVSAIGSSSGAGIGGGYNCAGGNITITGGTVSAVSSGSVRNGAGIGGGCNYVGATVTITGGNVKAYVGDGYGSYGTLILTDGKGHSVSRTTVTLDGVTSAQRVTDLTVSGATYGTADMTTLDTNKIYLYLPTDTSVYQAKLADGTTKVGSVAAGTSGTLGDRFQLIYTAPASRYYTGNPIFATVNWGVSDDYAEEMELGAITLTYKQGDTVIAAPIELGVYDVYASAASSDYNDAVTEQLMGSFFIAERPLKNANGVYEIKDAFQMNAFADIVNDGEPGANAILMADISLGNSFARIGTSAQPYTGTFDGGGHTVTVNYTGITADTCGGVFDYVKSATIQNLTVAGSISSSNHFVGGVVGKVATGATFTNVLSRVEITSTFSGDNTHGGIAAVVDPVTMTNCGFVGSITNGKGTKCGGLVGWSNTSAAFENCFMAGTMSLSTDTGSATFSRGNGVTVTNCYYQTGYGTVQGTAKSETEFKNGAVAWLLNGSSSENPVWFQNLGEGGDAYPVLKSTGSNTVYLIGDSYANVLSCRITVTSAQKNGTGTVSVVSITPDPNADGCILQYTSVTATATAKEGYHFVGWFEKADVYNGSPLCSTLAYTFTAERDIALAAVFEANENTTLTVSGSGFTVNGGTEQTQQMTGDYPLGTTITLTATNTDKTFMHWKNASGKIVSTAPEYTFPLVAAADITLVRTETAPNRAFVEFVSAYGQVLSGKTYEYREGETNQETVVYPVAPSKVGFLFSRWDLTQDEIYEKIQGGEKHIQVQPLYNALETKYNINVFTVVDGTATERGRTQYTVGQTTTVTAPKMDGYKFSHWAASAETGAEVLSYRESYFLQITGNIDLYAVYIAEEAPVVQMPAIAVTDKYAQTVGGMNKVAFVTTHSVPTGYTMVEHGVLYGISNNQADTLVLGGSNMARYTAKDATANGVYTMSIQVGSKTTTVITLRGYMIVKNDSTGNLETIYSALAQGSYDGMNKN